MNIGFIGAGKVGCSLGAYFILQGFFISGYYSRSLKSADEAAVLTDSEAFENVEGLLQKSDIVFITVSDGAILDVWNEIKAFNMEGKTICHCSGAMSSDVFSAEDRKCNVCSMHPLMAVSSKSHDMSQAFFTIEGDIEGIEVIKRLLDKCGNTYQQICNNNKVKYHAAAAVASNLAVGLWDMAISMLMECGFDESAAREALAPLVTGNAQSVMDKGAKAALTGPVSRGDISTVAKHLDVLQDEDREIYRLLSRRLLKLAKLEDINDYNSMKGILDK